MDETNFRRRVIAKKSHVFISSAASIACAQSYAPAVARVPVLFARTRSIAFFLSEGVRKRASETLLSSFHAIQMGEITVSYKTG